MSVGEDISSYVPQVRPHNKRRDGKIFFMISKRPLLELSREEVLLYDDIDGRKTVAELERVHPGASNRLRMWRKASVVELIAPISKPAHPHLVVIEPHMDDAALSAGGRLLHLRGRCRTTIVSVVKRSNFTSYLTQGRDFLNVAEITDLRQQESLLAAKLLGAEHHCLDWADASLRCWPAERWSSVTAERFRREPQIFTNLLPSREEVSSLAEQLFQYLNPLALDELWIPMGLGNHVDHRTTRSACLLMLHEARQRFGGIPVTMYEDIPYAATLGHVAQVRAALAGGGTRLVRTTEDITDVFEEKVRAVSVYASQFKVSYIEPVIRRLAERESTAAGKLAEAYHRLEGEIHLPREVKLSREAVGLGTLQSSVHSLVGRGTKLRNIAIVALPSGSLRKWETDSESIAAAFPSANLRVYLPEDMHWQIEQGGNDRFRLELVRGRFLGWVGVILREFFRFRTPTVILWRGAYGAAPGTTVKRLANVLIKGLFPFRRVLFARTLWDFCCVLSEQQAQTEVSERSSDLGRSSIEMFVPGRRDSAGPL